MPAEGQLPGRRARSNVNRATAVGAVLAAGVAVVAGFVLISNEVVVGAGLRLTPPNDIGDGSALTEYHLLLRKDFGFGGYLEYGAVWGERIHTYSDPWSGGASQWSATQVALHLGYGHNLVQLANWLNVIAGAEARLGTGRSDDYGLSLGLSGWARRRVHLDIRVLATPADVRAVVSFGIVFRRRSYWLRSTVPRRGTGRTSRRSYSR